MNRYESWYDWFQGIQSTEASERQKQLRHLLHRQIEKSDVKLKPTVKNDEETLESLLDWIEGKKTSRDSLRLSSIPEYSPKVRFDMNGTNPLPSSPLALSKKKKTLRSSKSWKKNL
jgi:hypothetical protein